MSWESRIKKAMRREYATEGLYQRRTDKLRRSNERWYKSFSNIRVVTEDGHSWYDIDQPKLIHKGRKA